MRLRSSALALLLVSGVSSACFADETLNPALGSSDFLSDLWQKEKVSVALRTDYLENSKTFNGEQNLWGQTAELKAYPLVDSSIDGKIDARVIEPNSLNGDQAIFDLIEGYVTFHLGQLDIRAGKQVVGWGRADGINPTDNLTPRNLTVQLPFVEDSRLGTTALKLDYYLDSEIDISLFGTPFFSPTQFPLPSNAGYTFNQILPTQTLQHSEVGVKLNKTGGDFDWSLSYFRGYRLLPSISLDGNNPSSTLLDFHYDQVDVAGADFARNLGPFGIRGEAAYVHPTGPDPTDPSQINPYFQWVFGVDRSFDQELNVNLQIIGRLVQNFQAADPSQAAALLNDIVNSQQDPESYEISFRVSDSWFNETLGAEVFGVIDLTRNDGYLRPSVNYAFNDRLKGWVGWDIYYGDQYTQFGFLQPIQGFFAEARYTF